MAGRVRAASDDGSITPLAVGFATIALALILLAALVTDVWLAHRKLFALADSAALAAAESFDPVPGEQPAILLTDDGVTAAARAYIEAVGMPEGLWPLRVEGASPDGRSAEVTLTVAYSPALLSPFADSVTTLEARALVRGGLRL
ncbi:MULTISPECIES: pilus assembly protein TadG-related protein [Brevibacterium]|uniref:Putative Flp pilus-assembly TadG-like N-terminal domain-containing protein n=1 Tax=Brevibacterium salitolerans TaxID=1403566 RepID=A0ABN2WZX6_9MICO|nr:pilus assembly protein TadG-related protein [Brevibacterium sp.]